MISSVDHANNSVALADLRAALLELEPSGANGFEGLLAVIFSSVTGQDFRLARSGLQNGKDGATLSSDSYVSFEAKRYDSKIPDDQVLTKMTRLIAHETPPHLWVLGATVEASTQMLETMEVAAAKNGISVLILDWPSASTLPPLAVACAMAPKEAIGFLYQHVADQKIVVAAEESLSVIAAVPVFLERAAQLSAALRTPSLAGPNARAANERWLGAALDSRHRAKSVFGQALAPNAENALRTRNRSDLVEEVVGKILSSTAGEIIVLSGQEGHGKSWLFAQTWLAMDHRPLTVIVPASTFKSVTPYGRIGPLLIGKFIEQTDDNDTDQTRRRWEAQVSAWGPRQADEPPRFIVCVDGLNEQPDIEWPRWLDGASAWVAEHGGVVVVTARQAYFRDRVRSALLSPVAIVTVPEWSVAELTDILTERGIDLQKVASAVFDRLRNPRILGIAFELLDKVQVEAFTELTVDRLLFEHIRIGAQTGYAREPVDQFVKRLALHAQEIIERIKQQQVEDRLVFEQDLGTQGRYQLTPDLVAVTAEHFFRPLPDDPTLYTLSDEGLTLALGLSIIQALRQAERNDRDIGEALGALIDPIAALDKTAEAVFSAVMVASIDDRCSAAIQRALISGLLQLQNLDPSNYPAFVPVVRAIPDAALWSLYDLAIAERHAGNQDWLVSALRESRDRTACWAIVSEHVERWLRSYSVDPALGVMKRRADDEAGFLQSLGEQAAKLEERQDTLSASEQAFVAAKMIRREGFDPNNLYRPALELLAGKPVAPFAEAIVALAYAMCFNSSHHTPDAELNALVRFNKLDWSATRKALMDASAFLRGADASWTGQWALVTILRATSTPEDADEAHTLVEVLTADRERFSGWRLIENYCATDPCDPLSDAPDGIEKTAEDYNQLNPAELSVGRSMGQADHFLEDARPAMARFTPETAMATHRKKATAVFAREGLDKWLAITSLEHHTAVLDTAQVQELKRLAVEYAKPFDDKNREHRDAWLISQYGLLLALPHLDGDDQVELFLSLPPHGAPMLKLGKFFRPCSPGNLERLLDSAVQAGDQSSLLLALAYARHADAAISDHVGDVLRQLMLDQSSVIRAQVLALAVAKQHAPLLEEFAASGWTAASLHPREQFYEVWYGSWALICAAELGLLDSECLPTRLSSQLYGQAATTLGTTVRDTIADRLHLLLKTLLAVDVPFQPPDVEQDVAEEEHERPTAPPLWSLVDVEPNRGVEEFFKRLEETDEEFADRQREGWKSFNRFQAELTQEGARLAIENVGQDAVEAYVEANFQRALQLGQLILKQPEVRLSSVVNFGLMLAKAVSDRDPELSCRLFGRLADERAFVRLTFGPSAIGLDAVCIWESAVHPSLEQLRAQRLDSAPTDHDLAQEVLAALHAGRSDLLCAYAEARLAQAEPAAIGRALMVIGFGLETPFADEALARHAGLHGFIGKAVRAARYAYDRNRWARHWFDEMAAAETPEAFWRFSMIYLKIVDGRSWIWACDVVERGEPFQRFGPSISSKAKSRIENWKSKREKTLLGETAPAQIYTLVS